ncbi:unnamed protein product [Urochloa decumbens]|uniref:PUB domain-containing protein n=1 Tax=Urochloa decumbens TaxID=240449 RepID=A0ABC9FHK0_9POAL
MPKLRGRVPLRALGLGASRRVPRVGGWRLRARRGLPCRRPVPAHGRRGGAQAPTGQPAPGPKSDKFRRVRLGNPRIKEAVADREGGVEFLEPVGFQVGDEDGELFAVMDEVPGDVRLARIRRVVLLLERAHPSAPLAQVEADPKESCSNGVDGQEEVKKAVDRQIRVFFSVLGSFVPYHDAPDSFYNLTGEEIRNEAKMRRERLEQSRLLIPKSYKEKHALAARQKYKQAVIRVQFPDRVILQGVFLPGEATGSLYEFVASALKQPGLEFELI